MLSDRDEIRQKFEREFDIPFKVEKQYEFNEPSYVIFPDNDEQEFFEIHVSFRNRLRLIMEVIPQKYGADFVRAIGRKNTESRKKFIRYAQFMISKGARITMKVNNEQFDFDDSSVWPLDWNRFECRFTKIPVFEEEKVDYVEATKYWGSLLMGMVLSLADIMPVDEQKEVQGYREGDVKKVLANRYERNPLNRKLCIATHGYDCDVCGMNFEKIYGEIGKEFIHVHHIVPVSQIGPGYIIDPINDLVPVCPNCHAMIHRYSELISIEALRAVIKNDRTE